MINLPMRMKLSNWGSGNLWSSPTSHSIIYQRLWQRFYSVKDILDRIREGNIFFKCFESEWLTQKDQLYSQDPVSVSAKHLLPKTMNIHSWHVTAKLGCRRRYVDIAISNLFARFYSWYTLIVKASWCSLSGGQDCARTKKCSVPISKLFQISL